jgi:hypothetical protein
VGEISESKLEAYPEDLKEEIRSWNGHYNDFMDKMRETGEELLRADNVQHRSAVCASTRTRAQALVLSRASERRLEAS